MKHDEIYGRKSEREYSRQLNRIIRAYEEREAERMREYRRIRAELEREKENANDKH